MEGERKWRLLIPPSVLLASVLCGAALQPDNKLTAAVANVAQRADLADLVVAAVAGGVFVVAFGFVLSTISIASLSVIFGRWWGGFETPIGERGAHAIWELLFGSVAFDRNEAMYAVVAYDHWLIPPQTHAWVQRRWNAFMTGLNTTVATLAGPVVGLAVGIVPKWPWVLATACFAFLFACNAFRAQRQALAMLSFLAAHRIAERPHG